MVSIIMLAYQNNILTVNSLDSIIYNTTADYEIIVIDNNPENNRLVLSKERYKRVRVIKNSYNSGFARGSNQGAAVAGGQLLLFLNNDTIVTSGWLKNMIKVINKDKKNGIVGCKLLFPENHLIQHAGIVFVNRLPGHVYYGSDPGDVPINEEKEYPAVTGACLLIKKRIFQLVGGFDVSYINSYEDVDLCLKVRARGYRVVYTPESLVYHYGSKAPGRHRYDKRNLRLFLARWNGSNLLE